MSRLGLAELPYQHGNNWATGLNQGRYVFRLRLLIGVSDEDFVCSEEMTLPQIAADSCFFLCNIFSLELASHFHARSALECTEHVITLVTIVFAIAIDCVYLLLLRQLQAVPSEPVFVHPSWLEWVDTSSGPQPIPKWTCGVSSCPTATPVFVFNRPLAFRFNTTVTILYTSPILQYFAQTHPIPPNDAGLRPSYLEFCSILHRSCLGTGLPYPATASRAT
jgi:hypothetical protein